jgi:hypothetical protein
MSSKVIRTGIASMVALVVLGVAVVSFAQIHPRPDFGPPHKPLIKLIGFLNLTPSEHNTRPILTFKLPDDEKRYTFLLTDMRIMAGPLRTPESILAEVKPFSTNFYLRASRDVTAQISSATPAEQLVILAEYSSADRSLLVKGIEKNEEPQKQ